MNNGKKTLSVAQRTDLLVSLKARFENNMRRHESLTWDKVQGRLETHPAKLWSLHEMEKTGGEPDVVGRDSKTDEHVFYDCSAESPAGRRNICYYQAGREAREKQGRHPGSALDMSDAIGIELLTEEQYRELQKLGSFDAKTSSG